MRRLVTAAAVAGMVTAATLIGAGSASAADTGTVYVVHGIPDTPVDVYVDGALTLDDFQPGTVAGPLALPAGTYDVAITAADAADDSSPVLSGSAEVAAGVSASLVAHLTAAGEPALTAFVNDTSTIAAGETRLVVRHTAAAPAVDVRAGGAVVLAGVTNPQQGELNIPAGTVSADVTLAGTSTVAIGPADLTLAEGTATFVHAVGSAEAGNLALVAFTITGLHSSPSGVPAGSGPADSPAATVLLIGLLAAGAGATVFGGRRLLAGRTS
ncbi:DUF4397 domain-containing protein [Nakamurella flavida]|uniref:DUF4397 domain-containing protein n=1 Tax=Nakamurella flavida TaxID=363630 RepID=A0A939C4Z2_9ACTN|nr:DUF4397 domain-containing protein [Nakamurella flavida]MBM9475697.1 DUF4397 domain-containing protein [Nakamurella flavida]MDP9778026.1 hypothetical protein [Nakamurella flavida]